MGFGKPDWSYAEFDDWGLSNFGSPECCWCDCGSTDCGTLD